jgi:hypothetical protein
VRLLLPLVALLCGCASSRPRTSWIAVAPCTLDDAAPGSLLVKVVDAAGVPLSGVIVEARARRSEPIARSVADASGSARLRVAPAGTIYELRASLPGFHATCVEEVRAIPGCTTLLQLPVRLARR